VSLPLSVYSLYFIPTIKSGLDYAVLYQKGYYEIIVNNELDRPWKKAVLAYFIALSQLCLGVTVKTLFRIAST
jgi:hypothetical protein